MAFIKAFRNWLDSWKRQPPSEPIESSSDSGEQDSDITIFLVKPISAVVFGAINWVNADLVNTLFSR